MTWRWVVDAVAVYRLTRLVTADGITEPLRDAIDDWSREGGRLREKAAELVTCPWCMSMWWSLGLVFIVRRAPWWPRMADALAFSAVAGLVSLYDE